LTSSPQIEISNFFIKHKIENFTGVPDSTLKQFISYGLKKNKIIITSREEEAIGIACGMFLSGNNSIVFMQNAGFANSLSTITSLVQLYNIPLIFLIGWRGYLKNDAPEHEKIGRIQPKLLKDIGLTYRIINNENWQKNCFWALDKIKNGTSCALVIPREFID